MKNIFYLVFPLFLLVSLNSCMEDDPEVYDVDTLSDRSIDFESVFLNANNRNLVLAKLAPGQTQSLGALVVFGGAPKSSPINYTYEAVSPDSTTLVLPEGLVVNESGSIPAGKLQDELPITVELDKFPLGEPQQLSLRLTSSDASITNKDVVNYTFTIVCPSELAGTYTAVATGQSTDDCCPEEVTVETTVTLTGADGAYTLNDFSSGLYYAWYAVYGVTEEMAIDGTLSIPFNDVCNDISGLGSEPFGTEVSIEGSVNTDTGVITYTWTNGYDDVGTVTLTPQ